MAMLLAVLVLSGLERALSAQDATQLTGEALVGSELFSSTDAIAPGAKFELAIRFKMKPHWYIYWRNAGGSGMPPSIDVQVPEGFVVGETQWPTPEVFPGAEPSYGYAGETVLLVPVTAPAKPPSDGVEITVALNWLVCKKACLFGQRTHTLRLPVVGDVGAAHSEHQALFDAWRLRMPRPSKSVNGLRLQLDDGRFIIEGPLPGARLVWFYPYDTPGVMPATPGPIKGRFSNGRFDFDIPLKIEPGNALDGVLKFAGIVVPIPEDPGRIMSPISIDFSIQTGKHSSPSATTSETQAPSAGS